MTISRSSAAFLVAAMLCVTLGAGCAKQNPVATPTPVDTAPSTGLRGIVAGDAVVLEEPAAVVDGKLKAGPVTRRVTTQVFTMGQSSDAMWELMDASNAKVATGTWMKAALRTAHPFYLPAVFDSKARPVEDASLLWLAQDEYRELKATSGTTIDPRFTSIPDWATRMKASPAANRAYAAFTRLVTEAEQAKKDLPYARLQKTSERKLMVNGKESTVPVLTVRNWYGTYDILDRADNPLVLAFTLDPDVAKNRLNVEAGDGLALANLVNYHVKEIVYTGR